MEFVHSKNIKNKISEGYNDKGAELQEFYDEVYTAVHESLKSLNYSSKDPQVFEEATNIINDYLTKLDRFSTKHSITSQSKFRSTFLEELSTYLFHTYPLIEDGSLGIFNKGIYSGLKINGDQSISIMKKDVDFCIGKKVQVAIDQSAPLDLIIPVIAVEVKTYLDGTMFGEVQFSTKLIKNATPNTKTYVLMETNSVGKDKIIAARYDNILTEMFVLRKDTSCPIDYKVLLDYYCELADDLEDMSHEDEVVVPGRLIKVTE